MQPQESFLTALPEKSREQITALSERLGETPLDVVDRALASFISRLDYLDSWSSPKHKPENPRLVALVLDPEHRRIYRAALRAMAKDSARSDSREYIQARGRVGGLARTRNLGTDQLSEIGRQGGTQRWRNQAERDQDINRW